jgi:hypothetical protein
MRVGPLATSILLMSLIALAAVADPLEEYQNVGSQRHTVTSAGQISNPSSSVTVATQDKSDTSPTVIVGVESVPKSDKTESEWSKWATGFRGWLFGWQGVLFALVIYLLFVPAAPATIKRLLQPFRSVKFFGAEFVINRVAGEDVEQSIRDLRESVTNQFDEWLRLNPVASIHREIVDEVIGRVVNLKTARVRSTIYVADLLFADSLYQLLDYYPSADGPHGRVFSARYGIIGKAWRLQESDYDPSVTKNENELKKGWGMTSAEAPSAGHGKQSFACIAFKRTGRQGMLGLLYLDSPEGAIFGNRKDDPTWQGLEQRVQATAQEKGLLAKLEALNRALIDRSAQIDIYHP